MAQIHGRAGGSLATAEARRRFGEQITFQGHEGETSTARSLAETFRDDPNVHVLHDLHIPASRDGRPERGTGQIDHLVVAGRSPCRVLVIDSKRWAPGRVWTLGGKSRRGFRRFPVADKRTVGLAVDRLRAYLEVALVNGLIVVHPAGKGQVRLGLYRPADGVRACTADQAPVVLRRLLGPGVHSAPDPRVIAALDRLLISTRWSA